MKGLDEFNKAKKRTDALLEKLKEGVQGLGGPARLDLPA